MEEQSKEIEKAIRLLNSRGLIVTGEGLVHSTRSDVPFDVPELTLDAPDHTNFKGNDEALVNKIKF